jgi:hypothetical protein
MRPAELKREIERLTVDAATSRGQLSSLRAHLREASTIVAELRALLTTGTTVRPASERAQRKSVSG